MFTKSDIEKYFLAEKSGAMMFMILGALAILLAAIFFFGVKANWYKGAAITLIVVGVIHTAVGLTVYRRADAQRMQTVYALDMDPAFLQGKELPRIQKVNHNFRILFYAEIVLLALALILFFYFRRDHTKDFWLGLLLLVAVEMTVSIIADQVAAYRAAKYTMGLEDFLKKK